MNPVTPISFLSLTFAPALRQEEEVVAVDDGMDPVVGSFVPKRDYFDELFEDHELNPEVPKSLLICDMKYSELISCLDRHLIYQMKLKLNLSLMEHYERHFPPAARSAMFGTVIWPGAEYGRTMYTIRQRIGPLCMRMQKRCG
ncbi:putative S-adenosyl-L-methionine-dependent methyltransferase [Helianthus annuus]|nr:putative S-adenosyl-L-methionine-dependent methyltransferase [Helianthus annuus]